MQSVLKMLPENFIFVDLDFPVKLSKVFLCTNEITVQKINSFLENAGAKILM